LKKQGRQLKAFQVQFASLLRTISPHSLREKLKNGDTIALIDLLIEDEYTGANFMR
jgi:hypothetical protein